MTVSYRFGRHEVRPVERQLLVDGKPVALGARALDLLLALIERRDRIVRSAELFDLVWPGLVVEENNLKVQVSNLRKALGPQAIVTVPGRGYRFAPAVDLDGGVTPPANASAGASGASTTAGADPSVSAHPLPELFGRAADLQAVQELLAAHPLVTIVGAGGIGKTALARAAFEAARRSFAESFVIEFAALADPALVPAAIAAAMKVSVGADGRPAEAIQAWLRGQQALLLLDNCEHLVDAVADCASALLAACPRLRLLATSQEPLKIERETVFRLGTLAIEPRANEQAGGAVELFVARARQADARLKFDAGALAVVADICRRLDGIALAIELAAARVPLLGLQGLRARLDERFRILTGGARTVLRRHQTLRATLEWSHGLLSAEEQVVFRRLGVFTGGFSLDLAQRVVADPALDRWTVLDVLGHLVDKSLVLAQGADEPRYHLLETTRAYALEKLAAAGETPSLLRRHAEGLRDLLRESLQRPWTLKQLQFLRLVAEIDNLRAALDWAAPEERALACSLFAAGGLVWEYSGQRAEAVQRGLELLPLPGDLPRAERAGFNLALASNGENSGRTACLLAARSAAEDFAALNLPERQLEALGALVFLSIRRGDQAASDEAMARARALVRSDTPPLLRAGLLAVEGAWHRMGDRYPEGLACVESQKALYREVGSEGGVWIAEVNVCAFLIDLGEFDAAIERLDWALAEFRRLNTSVGDGWLHEQLCRAWMEKGEFDKALAYARDGMSGALREDNPRRLLRVLVLLHGRRGDHGRAATLSAFFEQDCDRLQWALRASERKAHQETVESARAALGRREFERLRKIGAELSLERAIALALAQSDGARPGVDTARVESG